MLDGRRSRRQVRLDDTTLSAHSSSSHRLGRIKTMIIVCSLLRLALLRELTSTSGKSLGSDRSGSPMLCAEHRLVSIKHHAAVRPSLMAASEGCAVRASLTVLVPVTSTLSCPFGVRRWHHIRLAAHSLRASSPSISSVWSSLTGWSSVLASLETVVHKSGGGYVKDACTVSPLDIED